MGYSQKVVQLFCLFVFLLLIDDIPDNLSLGSDIIEPFMFILPVIPKNPYKISEFKYMFKPVTSVLVNKVIHRTTSTTQKSKRKGWKLTEETKDKMKAYQSKRSHLTRPSTPIRIYDIVNGKVTIYPSMQEASKAISMNVGSMSRRLKTSGLKPYKDKYIISVYSTSEQPNKFKAFFKSNLNMIKLNTITFGMGPEFFD